MLTQNILRACIRAAIDDIDCARMLEQDQGPGTTVHNDHIAKHYKRSEDLMRDVWSHLEHSTLKYTEL